MWTMVDEIYDRAYQSGRAELHGAIGRALASIGRGLGAMHRFEWSAPWSPRDKNGGKDVGIA
jgi:hypothetical protein